MSGVIRPSDGLGGRDAREPRWRVGWLVVVVALLCPARLVAAESLELTPGMFGYRPKPVIEESWAPLVEYINTGVLEQPFAEGRLSPDQIAVVHPVHHDGFPYLVSTDLYPGRAFAALPGVSEHISHRLTSLLIGLEWDNPAGLSAGVQGFTIPADYKPAEEAMMLLRPPFEGAPEFGWADVRDRYTDVVILGIVGGLLVSGLASALVINNRRLRRSRQTARRLSDRLQRIIDATRAGTWEWNVQTGEVVVNRRWAEMLGYQLEELAPTTVDTWHSLLHPDDQQVSSEALESFFSGESDDYDLELRMRHKDGRWIWVHTRGRVFSWTPDGKPLWMFGTHVDITRRWEAMLERDESLRRLQDLSRSVPGTLYQFRMRPDGSSHFPYVNPSVVNLYGCTPEELNEDARPVFQVIHPDDIGLIEQSLMDSKANLTTWHEVFRVNHPKLGLRWLEGNATPSHQDDGSVLWHGHIRDITELYENRERIRLAAKVFEASQEGIMITDASRRIVDVNRAFTQITGYTRDEVIGCSPSILRSGRQDAAFYATLYQELERTGTWQGEIWNRRRSGEIFPELLSIAAVTGDDGQLEHYVAIFTDISELKAHENELDRIANFDALTGIPNRRLLGDRLQQAVAGARRSGQSLAVCMMDLDGFKPVNDRYGHEAGDRLLVEIAQRLQALLREEDTVARLGGDEFVLLLRNPEGASVFERVLETVRKPVQLEEGEAQVSASLGVALLDHDNPCDGDQLLRQADQALYQAKEAGRDRYIEYQG